MRMSSFPILQTDIKGKLTYPINIVSLTFSPLNSRLCSAFLLSFKIRSQKKVEKIIFNYLGISQLIQLSLRWFLLPFPLSFLPSVFSPITFMLIEVQQMMPLLLLRQLPLKSLSWTFSGAQQEENISTLISEANQYRSILRMKLDLVNVKRNGKIK